MLSAVVCIRRFRRGTYVLGGARRQRDLAREPLVEELVEPFCSMATVLGGHSTGVAFRRSSCITCRSVEILNMLSALVCIRRFRRGTYVLGGARRQRDLAREPLVEELAEPFCSMATG